MAQPIKGEKKLVTVVKKKKKINIKDIIKKNIERSKKPHPKYGTSKLEKKFAEQFLDKLGIKYVYQYEMKDIGRYMDFYCEEANIGIEVDGDYFHGKGLLHEEKNPMQKKNERVDKIKDEWAAMHGVKLIRIWEYDINNNSSEVIAMLREEFDIGIQKKIIKDNKKKRH